MDKDEFVRATALSVIYWFAISLVSPVLSPYIKSLGYTDLEVSWIFGIFPLVLIFSSPIIGRLSDKFGRTSIIKIGIAVEICALALYIYSYSPIVLVAARILNAIALVSVSLVALSKIEDHLKDKERGRFAGISLSLQSIGQILAPLIGGFLSDFFFVQMPFMAAIILLSCLLLVLIVKSKDKIMTVKDSYISPLSQMRSFMKERKLRAVGVLGFLTHANSPAMLVFMPLFIVEYYGLSYSYVGIVIFLNTFSHLFQFYFGALSDRIGRRLLVAVGAMIIGLSWVAAPFAESYILFAGVFFIMGIGSSIWNIAAWSYMSDIGEKMKKEGQVLSSYFSIAKVGAFLSFLVAGLIVQYYSIGALFILSGITTVGGSIYFYVSSR